MLCEMCLIHILFRGLDLPPSSGTRVKRARLVIAEEFIC